MNEPSEHPDYNTEVLIGFGLLLATLTLFVVSSLLVWFAILRENQAFWTNDGGYPIWLRDLVLFTYKPLFLLAVMIVAALSMACFSKVCASVRFFVLESLVLVSCWALLATSGYIAMSNNIMNYIQGHELHSHVQWSKNTR